MPRVWISGTRPPARIQSVTSAHTCPCSSVTGSIQYALSPSDFTRARRSSSRFEGSSARCVDAGGSYRYTHSSDGNEFHFYGCFHEVRPSELIVQTFTFEGMPDGVALEKLWFEDLGDGRTRLVATSLVDSFEDRDSVISSGMEDGILESYERLDELLAK
ncbi:MAG: hypothetical protein FJW86_02045 [Actinobacteria bacterium]|nr:hypothetical protein [Actinomycetota bacterium]